MTADHWAITVTPVGCRHVHRGNSGARKKRGHLAKYLADTGYVVLGPICPVRTTTQSRGNLPTAAFHSTIRLGISGHPRFSARNGRPAGISEAWKIGWAAGRSTRRSADQRIWPGLTVTGRPRPLVLVTRGPPVARPTNARTRCLEDAAHKGLMWSPICEDSVHTSDKGSWHPTQSVAVAGVSRVKHAPRRELLLQGHWRLLVTHWRESSSGL